MRIAETLRRFREGEREIKCPCPFDVAIVLGGGLRLFNGEFTSTSYHLRRSLTFFDAQGLTAEGRHITPISCDRVIYEIIPELRQYMIDLYNSSSMKARIKREAQGVRDFHAKRYKSKPPQ